MSVVDLSKLAEPLPPEDIEWRLARSGKNDKGVWALCLAYMTSRAVQDRLDKVVGPTNWRVEFRELGATISCGIGIRIGEEWIWKWDGAGLLRQTDGLGPEDAGKGDYSNAMKRAAVQWGIGRYLYRLPETWAHVHPQGSHYGKTKDGERFRWDPPALPAWALPDGDGKPEAGSQAAAPPPAQNGAKTQPSAPAKGGDLACPSCGGKVWDNRAKKQSGDFSAKSPDYSCRDKEGCGWVLWIDGARKKLTEQLDTLVQAGAITQQSRDHVLQGTEGGDLAALTKADEWVADKARENEVAA